MTEGELWAIARQVCTPKELEALILAARGYGAPRSGRILDISPQAVTDRLRRAHTKIQRERTRRAEAA